MTVERARPVRLPKGSGLEAALAFQIKAVNLPEPELQWKFDRCCQHLKREHAFAYLGLLGCRGCLVASGATINPRWIHEYRRGRDWRFDFAWPDLMVACEVDGGTWSGGRHTRGDGFQRDAEKQNAAVLAGWKVYRFTGAMVEDGTAIEMLEKALADVLEL